MLSSSQTHRGVQRQETVSLLFCFEEPVWNVLPKVSQVICGTVQTALRDP